MNVPLRVVVVDDSTTFRKIVRDALAGIPGINVVGHAHNGAVAIQRLAELKPDVVTLDVEMPQVDGLGVLDAIKSMGLRTKAIMLSGLTSTGAKATTQALQRGAFDFVLKPSGSSMAENIKLLQGALEPRLKAAGRSTSQRPSRPVMASRPAPIRPMVRNKLFRKPEVAVLGISTGGPAALNKMLPRLPKTLSVPLLIVQHMPAMFTKTMADDLNRHCALTVVEASDNEPLKAGTIYIAPGGRQMKVQRTGDGVVARITNDPPVRSCRPSVDYLFESVAEVFGGNTVALVMTGMGDDGRRGCEALSKRGARILAQDEASCTVYGMPRAVAESGVADEILSLDKIADKITEFTHSRGLAACL